MAIDTIYLIYGLIFLGVIFLLEGLYYLLVDGRVKRREVNRRLQALSSGQTAEEVLLSIRRERMFGDASRFSPVVWLEDLVIQSGTSLSLPRLGVLVVVFAVVLFVLLFGAMQIVLSASLILSVGIAAGFPMLILHIARKRRMKKFNQQLPDAIDIVVRGLRAGHPVNTAFSLVSRQMADPIGTEFGIIVDEMVYGREMDEALDRSCKRIKSQDLSFMVVAVNIQRQVGGNLAEVLSNLTGIIRERQRMKLKIKALSAEGRFSAIVLSLLPFVVMALVNLTAPRFYGEIVDDPLFMPIMLGTFAFMGVGVMIMWRMVNFRV